MKLSIHDNAMYADNLRLCLCAVGNDRDRLPAGSYPVITQFCHTRGVTLPNAVGLGWIGATHDCDIILGAVRGGRKNIVPSPSDLGRLLAILEAKEDVGAAVTLEIAQ